MVAAPDLDLLSFVNGVYVLSENRFIGVTVEPKMACQSRGFCPYKEFAHAYIVTVHNENTV
jgi:hypothetical protein